MKSEIGEKEIDVQDIVLFSTLMTDRDISHLT